MIASSSSGFHRSGLGSNPIFRIPLVISLSLCLLFLGFGRIAEDRLVVPVVVTPPTRAPFSVAAYASARRYAGGFGAANAADACDASPKPDGCFETFATVGRSIKDVRRKTRDAFVSFGNHVVAHDSVELLTYPYTEPWWTTAEEETDTCDGWTKSNKDEYGSCGGGRECSCELELPILCLCLYRL